MERYPGNVLGLSDVQWPGSGEMVMEEGYKLWFIGEESKKEKGVAIMVYK